MKPPQVKPCELWSLALNLSDPRDYERGWAASPLIIPEQILAFSRSSPEHLLRSPLKIQHHRFVLIAALEGEGTVCVDQGIFRLQPKKLFLIFPFQFHHFLSFTQTAIRWIFLTFETKEPSRLEPLQNGLSDLTPELSGLLRDVLEIVSPRQPPLAEKAAQVQLLLALLLSRLLVDRSVTAVPPVDTDSAERLYLLERVNQFINRNIGRNFMLKELAKEIGYSESHLRSLFRSTFRMTLGRYISEARLRKATGLLHQGILTISEVSEACGYSSHFSFSRTFRSAHGCSPREFRKRCEAAYRSQPARE